eukprot:gb/GEZJ01003455.1/.p4 GENE.gb/GEZJ01003455.1/~~gb/GEZJ01003455.1/.p4  ORF type:complete len:160 (+),score=19.92 gb/GEZJ01003455.1/:1737-2216(+)
MACEMGCGLAVHKSSNASSSCAGGPAGQAVNGQSDNNHNVVDDKSDSSEKDGASHSWRDFATDSRPASEQVANADRNGHHKQAHDDGASSAGGCGCDASIESVFEEEMSREPSVLASGSDKHDDKADDKSETNANVVSCPCAGDSALLGGMASEKTDVA